MTARALGVALGLLAVLAAAPAADEVRPWTEYRTIMWIGDSAGKRPEKLPLFFQRLREMGINTGMVGNGGDPQPFLDAKLPYYVENIVNRGLCLKWSSKVSDWDKMVTAWRTPRDEAGLVRDYSLDDPQWLAWAKKEMQSVAKRHAAHAPLAYDIRDELSTTMSANPFDYDFSPTALAGFREWLKTQYKDLAALNAEWDTKFTNWDDVKPFTTDQIKNRMSGGESDALGFPRGKPDWQAVQQIKFDPVEARKNPARWNLAPWCDHRTYMDIALARTLGDLRQAARELDPRTPVGIEGTQMASAFGGYDLWRLSQVLDWVEPYDIGNAREIFGSFMPGKTMLTTVGEQDAKAAGRRLWHLLLEGDKGCLIWWSEDCIDWKSDDYALTPRGKALAPVLAEMTSPLAHLFLRAERETDPIAIHYSQPSIQVDWLLESTVDGSSWLRRFSSHEAEHNRMAKRRQAWVKLLQDAGYTPRFISSEQIEHGALAGIRMLVLPNSVALTDSELSSIEKFYGASGSDRFLAGSGELGAFDMHGHLRTMPIALRPPLAPAHENGTWLLRRDAQGSRTAATPNDLSQWLGKRTALDDSVAILPFEEIEKAVPRSVRVTREASVRTHRYKSGTARLLAFERNIVWQMSEDLKQRGGNEALEKPVTFDAKLAAPAHIYDLRSGKYVGHTASIPVALDPWQPSLFALLAEKLPAGADIVATLARDTAKP